MPIDESDRYGRFLEKAALKWGVSDPDEARISHKIVQTLIFRDSSCPQEISIFAYGGQYGFCLSIQLKGRRSLYGPFLGFSEPYSEYLIALDAAILEIVKTAQEYGSPGEKRKVEKWAKSLVNPKQLRLKI